jgi:beta-lactamase regulating signal transducer with metallopeptidase domain
MILSTFLAGLVPLAQRLLTASWQAAVLAALVFVIVHLAGRRLSAGARHALWLLVLARLLLPATPASPVSVFNLLPQSADLPTPVASTGADAQADPAPNRDGAQATPLAAGPTRSPQATSADPPAPPNDPAVSLAPQSRSAPVSAVDGEPTVAPPPAAGAHAVPASAPRAPRASALRASDAPPRPWWTWLQWAVGAYALVALALLARLGVAAAVLARRVRRLPAVTDGQVVALLERCRRQMGVRRRVQLRRTEAGGPALTGLVSPTILLPAGAIEQLPREQLRFVLLHELGHLRRWDVATHLLSRILAAVHWPNLAVHAAFARMRADRELACDELVLARVGGEHGRSYGHTIVTLAQHAPASAPLPGLLGVAERDNHIRRRIEMITRYRPANRVHAILALVLTALLAATALTSAQPAVSAEGEPRQADPPAPAKADGSARSRGYRSGRTAEPDAQPAGSGVEAGTVEAKLDETIKTVDFRDVPLADVIEFLRHVTGANLLVRWNALAPAGIEPTTNVSLRLNDLPARRVLRAVLDAVSVQNRLDWMIDKGVVYISTADDLSWQPRRIVFDVRDLLEAGRSGRATPEASSRARAMTPGAPAGGARYGAAVPRRGPSRSSRSASTTRDELIEAVQGVCLPTTWRGNGGHGVVSVISGKLLVTQGPRQLRRVHRLIARLRANVLNQRDAATLGRIEQERRRDARLADKLAEKIGQVDFQSVPLGDVIDFVRELSGANIQTQWGVLERAGIDRQAPVTLRLKGASAATVLRAALGGVQGEKPIGYAMDDGVVLIATTDWLSLCQKVEVWNVRPIVDDPSQGTPSGALVKAITGHVAPDSWTGRGGYGFAGEVLGQLVVRHTPDRLREVDDLLTVLLTNERTPDARK